jgi:hypothetical protein
MRSFSIAFNYREVVATLGRSLDSDLQPADLQHCHFSAFWGRFPQFRLQICVRICRVANLRCKSVAACCKKACSFQRSREHKFAALPLSPRLFFFSSRDAASGALARSRQWVPLTRAAHPRASRGRLPRHRRWRGSRKRLR